jgi:hypothetical protein
MPLPARRREMYLEKENVIHGQQQMDIMEVKLG